MTWSGGEAAAGMEAERFRRTERLKDLLVAYGLLAIRVAEAAAEAAAAAGVARLAGRWGARCSGRAGRREA